VPCSSSRLLAALLAMALMTVGVPVWAEPFGYSVNSRGVERDDRRVNALWQINLANGEAEYIGWTTFLDVEALALSPDGILYGADDDTNTIVTISTTSGFAQPVGGAGNRSNTGLAPLNRTLDFGMTFTCHGDLFVVSDLEQSLFRADLETGRLELEGAPGSLDAPITDLAVRGHEVFGIGVGLTASGDTAAPNLYRVNLEAATAELIGPLGEEAAPYNNAGLSFDENGVLWAITDRRGVGGEDLPSQILRIDPSSGAATLQSESIIGLESLAAAPPALCDRAALMHPAYPIPVLSRAGLAVLILALLLFATLRLRFQNS